MKDYLEKIINAKTEEANNLRAKVKESNSADEVRSLGETLDKVLEELNDAKEQLAKIEDEPSDEPKEDNPAEEEKNEDEDRGQEPSSEDVQRSKEWTKVEQNNLTKVFSQEERGGNKMKEQNLEQRKAFMEAIYSGNLSKLEKRADAYTTTGDVQYVIPENLVNDIIVEIEERGYILNKVKKTNLAVGQTIPVGLIQIKASWVGTTDGTNNSGEGLGSDVQKGGVEATVTFLNYKLRCEVGITHEASV